MRRFATCQSTNEVAIGVCYPEWLEEAGPPRQRSNADCLISTPLAWLMDHASLPSVAAQTALKDCCCGLGAHAPCYASMSDGDMMRRRYTERPKNEEKTKSQENLIPP